LRLPLAVAGLATLLGAVGAWVFGGQRANIVLAVTMVLFLPGGAFGADCVRSVSGVL